MPIKNRERALRRMRRLPDQVLKAAKAQLLANAADLVDAQRQAVSQSAVDSGTLRESIRFEDASSPTRPLVQVRAGGPTTTKPVRKGVAVDYDYAFANEFGTEDMTAQPFFFPVYRARKRQMKAAMKKAAREAIRAALAIS